MCLCLLLLAACSTNHKTAVPQIVYRKLECVRPPQCDDSRRPVQTNADLVDELVRTRKNLAVCKVGRDALQKCIDAQ